MRIMGLDPGQRRIGIAVSDEGGTIALPLETLERTSKADAVAKLQRVAREYDVVRFVLGFPLRMDGREGGAARAARRFGELLEQETGIPVTLWDERLSSASAARALTETGRSARQQRAVIDQMAATVILQSFLDAQQSREPSTDEP